MDDILSRRDLSVRQQLDAYARAVTLTAEQRQAGQTRVRAWRPAWALRAFIGQPIAVDNARYITLSDSYPTIDGWWVLRGRAFINDQEVPLRCKGELPPPDDNNGWPIMIRPVPLKAHDDPVAFLKTEILPYLIHPWSAEIEAGIVARKAAR